MTKSDNSQEKGSRLLSYTTLGFQLISFMLIFGLVGYWIDKKTNVMGGSGDVFGILLGVICGMFYTIRSLMRMK